MGSHSPRGAGRRVRAPVSPGQATLPLGPHILDRDPTPTPAGEDCRWAEGSPAGLGWGREGQQLGAMPLPARPAAAEMDMGQSQALPRKWSSGCSPCPSVIPLFLAPRRLSDKVHVDERAVWHDKSLHLTTETSQGRMAAHPVPQVHGGSGMPAQNPARTGAPQPLRRPCPGAEGAWASTSCLDAQQGLGRHCPPPVALAQMPAVEGPGARSPCSPHDAPLWPCRLSKSLSALGLGPGERRPPQLRQGGACGHSVPLAPEDAP